MSCNFDFESKQISSNDNDKVAQPIATYNNNLIIMK